MRAVVCLLAMCTQPSAAGGKREEEKQQNIKHVSGWTINGVSKAWKGLYQQDRRQRRTGRTRDYFDDQGRLAFTCVGLQLLLPTSSVSSSPAAKCSCHQCSLTWRLRTGVMHADAALYTTWLFCVVLTTCVFLHIIFIFLMCPVSITCAVVQFLCGNSVTMGGRSTSMWQHICTYTYCTSNIVPCDDQSRC